MENNRLGIFREIIAELAKEEALEELILIGSWTLYYYKIYFNQSNNIPAVRTTDLGFMIPVAGYSNPYGIEFEQEKSLNIGINDRYFSNCLMYFNSSKFVDRLDSIMRQGFTMSTYSDYVKKGFNYYELPDNKI